MHLGVTNSEHFVSNWPFLFVHSVIVHGAGEDCWKPVHCFSRRAVVRARLHSVLVYVASWHG